MKSWFRWFALLPPQSKAEQVKGIFSFAFHGLLYFDKEFLSSFLFPNSQCSHTESYKYVDVVGKNARFLIGKALGPDPPWLGEESRQQITVTHVLGSDKSLSSCHPLSATPIHLTYRSYTCSHLICSIAKHWHDTGIQSMAKIDKIWAKISKGIFQKLLSGFFPLRGFSNTKIHKKTYENICFTLCVVLISIILRTNVNALFKICLTHTHTLTYNKKQNLCVFWHGCLPLSLHLRVRKCACVYRIPRYLIYLAF